MTDSTNTCDNRTHRWKRFYIWAVVLLPLGALNLYEFMPLTATELTHTVQIEARLLTYRGPPSHVDCHVAFTRNEALACLQNRDMPRHYGVRVKTFWSDRLVLHFSHSYQLSPLLERELNPTTPRWLIVFATFPDGTESVEIATIPERGDIRAVDVVFNGQVSVE